MKKYLGVKIIHAEPCSQDQFAGAKNFGDLSKLSGGIDKEGYKVVYEDGYTSWSPKEVFEKAYRTIDNLTFGLAVEALKLGKKVSRAGWDGKGMWLKLMAAGNKKASIEGAEFEYYDYVGMKTADNKFVPWLASQTDILAEDWQIIE